MANNISVLVQDSNVVALQAVVTYDEHVHMRMKDALSFIYGATVEIMTAVPKEVPESVQISVPITVGGATRFITLSRIEIF